MAGVPYGKAQELIVKLGEDEGFRAVAGVEREDAGRMRATQKEAAWPSQLTMLGSSLG
jgi:hypothetical protein